jgi:16S rRNA (adenine1518-N6/adenine1519-N6)-dimethyltransferase
MNKSEVMGIIKQYGLHPNRKLGQNFLVSNLMRDKIIEAIALTADDRVLEIGPGLGALTDSIADAVGELTAVEIDSGFCRFLSERFSGRKNFRLIHSDFLKMPVEDSFTKIVSNLPYYCSTEILFRITRYEASAAYVMLQRELVQRITAQPGQKAYGAPSVTLGFYYEPDVLLSVSREAFYPRPEVTSSFLKLSRRNAFALEGDDIELFHSMVKSAFWGRRKTILKALADSPHLNIGREGAGQILAEAGIDGSCRGEKLGIGDYIRMVRAYARVMR